MWVISCFGYSTSCKLVRFKSSNSSSFKYRSFTISTISSTWNTKINLINRIATNICTILANICSSITASINSCNITYPHNRSFTISSTSLSSRFRISNPSTTIPPNRFTNYSIKVTNTHLFIIIIKYSNIVCYCIIFNTTSSIFSNNNSSSFTSI